MSQLFQLDLNFTQFLNYELSGLKILAQYGSGAYGSGVYGDGTAPAPAPDQPLPDSLPATGAFGLGFGLLVLTFTLVYWLQHKRLKTVRATI